MNNFAMKSEDMAEIAKTYHENIQATDNTTHDEQNQTLAREQVISEIPEDQKLNDSPNQMEEILQEENVLDALMSSKSGSAAGIDGIPYELWKHLHNKYKETCANEKPGFNVIKTLTIIMNDIQRNGIDKESDFALRWMCPLYKKRD